MVSPLPFILAGTLDTKSQEVAFCRDLIEAMGHRALVIDIGILGATEITPDIDRHAIARAAGTDIASIIARKDKNAAILTMRTGLAAIVGDLVSSKKAAGILGLGGGQGTVMITSVMQELPFGFPKVMVSAIANGGQTFGPLVGTSDITIIHSVADILGLNVITRKVLGEGVGAVIGMAAIASEPAGQKKISVGLTAAGVTTPCAMKIRELFEARGIEVIAFHCNGVGAHAMEKLVTEGKIQGVIDLSPKDIIDGLYGGIFPCYPERLRPIRGARIPCIVVPGTLDFILYGPVESVPPERRGRKFFIHNPLHTHVRADYAEMKATGKWIVDRLAGPHNAAAVMIPKKGFTQFNIENGLMFDPASDAGFVAGVREALAENPSAQTTLTEYDMHINEPAFAGEIVNKMLGMLKDRKVTCA